MKAEEIQAGKLFDSGQQLLIPLWQRHYSWDSPEWQELWTDIKRVRDQELAGHFLGSVVLKTLTWTGAPSEAKRYWVVDGQQRVTTLTVLVCAIRDRIAQLAEAEDDRERLVSDYTSQLLLNANLQEGHKDRLVLQERDRAGLGPIVQGVWDGSTGLLVERAYAYFKTQVSAMDRDDLLALLALVRTRLSAVWVTLEDGDNAHRVFQTLNAGGKQLRQADLVRNYFFLLLGEEGDEFYAGHWRQIEADLADRDLEDYLVAWTISQGHSGGRDSLFRQFHKDLLPHEDSVQDVLNYGHTLTATARYFRWIRHPLDSNLSKGLKRTMLDLRNWTTLPAEGLMLWLLRKYDRGVLTADQLQQGFEIILSFMARRQLAGYEPNLHKSIFVQTARKLIAAEDQSGGDIIERLHYLLSIGDDVRTWPTDEAILSKITSTPMYSASRATWVFSILERANRELFTEAAHVPEPLDRTGFSVEHIMPQTLTPRWVADLEEWGVESPVHLHQTRLHVLGNLTLTRVNSALGNQPFAEKRALLSDDSLRLNKMVTESTSWSDVRIQERSRSLGQLACRAYISPLIGSDLEVATLRYASSAPPEAIDESASDEADLDETNQVNESWPD